MEERELLNQVYQKLGGLDAKVDGLGDKVDSFREEVKNVRGRVRRLEARWTKLSDVVSVVVFPFTMLVTYFKPKS